MSEERLCNILIPVKSLSRTKSRLSSVLTIGERKQLMMQCITHTIRIVKSSSVARQVTVVTTDQQIIDLAKHEKVCAFRGKKHGINAALTEATLALYRTDSFPLLTVFADLPLLRVSDIKRLLRLGMNNTIVIGISKELTGTNAVLMREPLCVPYLFGKNSANKFIQTANRQHVSVIVCWTPTLSFDVDTPKDLKELNNFLT